ncbi:uncharacterized protein PHACADRAFT_209723 [Phanerochaete carnosa HHB-10118-sp]|uniref:Uncharacterized protein n=1 Tax=Phanerochaete carnosa (strain HHB-10118-sp) TaxID=650164 RepID=K5W432_PHACS|nr:uncharacterized protein PHACADRAFT_209723 [Phanerochaete carnosa HHB-10118-sp]EKM53875.1 hypothetical protein PHACADRAFT_209723 [Phanerochaete carnosa HHB-10118-sp]
MERAIGNLGKEIRQPSKPFANLAQCALRRCQTNAIKHMFPEVEPEPPSLPRGAHPLDSEHALLRKHEQKISTLPTAEAEVTRNFVASQDVAISNNWQNEPSLARWARLRLPNGQTARSAWGDEGKDTNNIRMSRMVKAVKSIEGSIKDAPVQAMQMPTGPPGTIIVPTENKGDQPNAKFWHQRDWKRYTKAKRMASGISDPEAESVKSVNKELAFGYLTDCNGKHISEDDLDVA